MSTATTARRLRRFLGTLLALGFGATWWSFIPVAAAATSVSWVAIGPEREPIAGAHTSAIAAVEAPPPPTAYEIEAAWNLRHPVNPEPPATPTLDLTPVAVLVPPLAPITLDLPQPPDPEPELSPDDILPRPIRTRSS